MSHRSHASADESVRNPRSILIDVEVTPFTIKRRSNPSAAFSELMERFTAARREDAEIARAFASFQERFKGVVLVQEDAGRLAELEARGADNLGIKVGSWPLAMGAGLAYMYDAALETLRSTDRPIEPGIVGARAVRMMARSLEGALPIIGAMSVDALELALNDERFADRLRDRAAELGVVYLDQPPGPCEHCIFQLEDDHGNIIDIRCGTKDECDLAAGLFLYLILAALLGALWDWLF